MPENERSMKTVSPYSIVIDAQLSLCNSPEWMEVIDAAHPYPQPVHMAHLVLERALWHIGIRAIDSYSGKESVTEELTGILEAVNV